MTGYSLDYKIQGLKTNFGFNGEVSFSLIDSIHSFYNRATLSVEDSLGLVQESFYTAPGVLHEIDYGFGEDRVGGLFSVNLSQLSEKAQEGAVAGRVNLNLLNNFSFQQEEKFTSYRDRVSNIVRTLIKPYFREDRGMIDFNDTGNLGTWLQPGMTDAKFINDILRPNAFSSNADNTPFYAWIGSDKKFHFRSYASMMAGNAKAKLFYRPLQMPQSPTDSQKEEARHTIMEFRAFSKPPTVTNKETNFYMLDPATGKVKAVNDSIRNHPQSKGEAVLARMLFESPEHRPLGFFTKDQQENFKGLQANHYREDLLLDKALVLLPPNFDLVSGSKVSLDAVLGAKDMTTSSDRYSGDWLVEMSEHLWSAKEKMGFSKLLLTRNSQTIPRDIPMKASFK